MNADERRRFEQVALPNLDAAYNLARWLTKDDHAAEDVVQEAYCRAARYFGGFRGGDGRPWLLGIVRRSAFDWLARRRSHAAASFDPAVHDLGDESENPELLAIRRCEQELVRAAIGELAPEFREVIVLRDMEGLSYQEIATVAEIPVGTVMSRLSRGRARLQQLLWTATEGDRR